MCQGVLTLSCWVKLLADNILNFFLIFPRKQDLTLHTNCLGDNLYEVSDPVF